MFLLPCSARCCDASGVLKINVILRRCAAATAAAAQMKAIKPSVERKKFIFIADYEHPAAPAHPPCPGLAWLMGKWKMAIGQLFGRPPL